MRDALHRLLAGKDAADGNAAATAEVVAAPLARDLLRELPVRTAIALVLVDHGPFDCGGPIAEQSPDTPLGDFVRERAQVGLVALELSRRASRTLVLKGADTSTWVPALARLLRLQYSQHVLQDMPAPPPLIEAPIGRFPTPLVGTYLTPLFEAPGSAEPLRLAWPRESFLDGDAPGTPLPATVEVAGRARILTYGPYLPLPAGRWRAQATLGFSPDIGRMSFILEADTGSSVDRGYFETEHGGMFTVDLEFTVTDALHPVELRLISQDSALEGQLALIEVALEQAPRS